ncbi:MAG: hypothetical protein ACQETI_04920 [Halobacteriota archaeon]
MIVGGVDPEAALDLAEAALGEWRGAAPQATSGPPDPSPSGGTENT